MVSLGVGDAGPGREGSVQMSARADEADFARTKKALDTCPFCYQDDRPPLTAIVALGRRTYMCCTQTEELAPGHCLIVPLQHHLASLEMEDDDWDEVRVRRSWLRSQIKKPS